MKPNLYLRWMLIVGGAAAIGGLIWWFLILLTIAGFPVNPPDSEVVGRIYGFRDSAFSTFIFGIALLTSGLFIGAIKHKGAALKKV